MRLAIVGSRSIRSYDLAPLVPPEAEEIISGGALGVDRLAEAYARAHNLKLTVFLPDYKRYGRQAPLLRDQEIAQACDALLALWDGVSSGTIYTVNFAKKLQKPVTVYRISQEGESSQLSLW